MASIYNEGFTPKIACRVHRTEGTTVARRAGFKKEAEIKNQACLDSAHLVSLFLAYVGPFL